MGQHGIRHLQEAGDVGAYHVVVLGVVFLGSAVDGREDVLHDALQLRVHFLVGRAGAVVVCVIVAYP